MEHMWKVIFGLIVFGLIILVIPIIVWSIGTEHLGITADLLAGDLLVYVGSVFTSIATIIAVVITINYNKSEIKKQSKRTYDEKLYDEVCQMARDIMIYLSLHELLSALHPIIKSRTRRSFEEQNPVFESKLIDEAQKAIDNTRLNLMSLDKRQWYYHELCKNEGIFKNNNKDAQNIKEYFGFIYELIYSIEKKLSHGSAIQQLDDVRNFFIEIDKFRISYQDEVAIRTSGLINGVKNILVDNLDEQAG